MEKKALSVRARQWRQIVSEGNSSPLTKTAWCRENGIRFRAFMYWQKKFRDEELDNLPDLQQRTEIQCREELPAFVDVTGVMPLEHPEDSRFVDRGCPGLEPKVMVQLGNSRIYIGDSAGEDLLCRVMRAVRNA